MNLLTFVLFENGAIFWGEIALALESFNTWLPPLSFYHQNPSKSLKTTFEAKGLQYTTDKVSESQRLFNVDLHTYLAIYRYGWGKG